MIDITVDTVERARAFAWLSFIMNVEFEKFHVEAHAHGTSTDEEIADAGAYMARYANLGLKYEKLMKKIEESDTLKSEWKRFQMLLKMAEGDK